MEIEKQATDLTNEVDQLLKRDKSATVNEASKIFTDMGNGINEFVKFSKGKGDLQQWIEAHRNIQGRTFSYEDAQIEMMLGEYDKKLERAPRPYLQQYINDKVNDKTIIKCRQCLPGYVSLLTFKNGFLSVENIENLYKENYRGYVFYDKGGRKSKCKIVKIWKSGKKRILEIKVASGHKINCSYNEKIWSETTKEFVLAKDIKLGESLKLFKDNFGKVVLEKGTPELIGYMYSDGTFFKSGNNRALMSFRNQNYEYIKDFERLVTKKHCRVYKHISKYNEKDIWDVYVRKDALIRKKLLEWGEIDKQGKNKKLPDIAMNLEKKQTSLLLNRLFAGDGYSYKRKRKKWDSYVHHIGLGSLSYSLLIQIQILFKRYNIFSIVKKDPKGKKAKQDFWRIVLSTERKNILRFMEEIGIYKKITKKDINFLRNEMENNSLFLHRKSHKKVDENIVVCIKKKRSQLTYDVMVEDKENHSFYANGILVSNSEFTENEINENIWLCANRPFTNVRHIFPTSGMAMKMAREKICTAIQGSPDIANQVKKPYSFQTQTFNNGSFYTVDSSWTDYQGRGPSSDKLTFDEYESQNPQIEDIYSESTSHSALARKTRISTPKFPNGGIDAKFQKGCGYEWHITCSKCKKEQIMSFPENIINFFELENVEIDDPEYITRLDKAYIGCKYCKTYINKTTKHYLETSRWIAKKKHLIPVRASYRVTYMMLAWKTGKEILYKYHTFKFIHQFWNEVMGFAFISPEARISREIFEQCQDKVFLNRYQKNAIPKNVSIGVDWGETSWVVIRANGFSPDTAKPKIIYIEKINYDSLKKYGYAGQQTDHVKRVDEIFMFFNAKIIINDANGIGVDRNNYLVRRYPTRAWGIFYDTAEVQRQKKKENLIIPSWNEKRRVVTVSRVGSFKSMIQEYEERDVHIPRIDPTVEEFIQHHANLAIETYVDEKTESLYQVVGHTGPDHLAHADLYAKIGFERLFNRHKKSAIGVIHKTASEEMDIINQSNIHPLL